MSQPRQTADEMTTAGDRRDVEEVEYDDQASARGRGSRIRRNHEGCPGDRGGCRPTAQMISSAQTGPTSGRAISSEPMISATRAQSRQRACRKSRRRGARRSADPRAQ